MSSILKLILLLFLLLFVPNGLAQNTANNVEYFRKAIFRALKEKQGQFSSELQVTRYRYGPGCSEILIRDHKEKFSFKTQTGEYSYYSSCFDDSPQHYYLYVNHKELYSFMDDFKYCRSNKFDKRDAYYHIIGWIPGIVFYENNGKFNYDLISPSILLEAFYRKFDEDKRRVKCEDRREAGARNPKNCSISFQDYVRLDYSFVHSAEYTMIPTKIEMYEAEMKDAKLTGRLKLVIEIKYLSFAPTFSEKPIVGADLPIQKGCKRISPESYPRIKTDYGTRFELELQVKFEYFKGTYGRFGAVQINRQVRSYTVKLFVDKANSISVAETIDESTNAPIRTYYDARSRLLHSVILNGKECSTFSLVSNRSLNWFYIQEMFARRPELFYADNSYSYLRKFRLDGVPTRVFEETVRYEHLNYNEKITTRKKSNEVPTNGQVFATHYYPKDANYWPKAASRLSIPKRIEISMESYFSLRYDNLTIDLKSFNANPKEPEKYDTSRCKDMDKKK